MEKQKTTDLGLVRAGHPFTWGLVVGVHDLGRYSVVEFVRQDCGLDLKSTFHIYVDGKDTHRGCDTLEAALIYAVAKGTDMEVNEAEHMAKAACKLLGVR